MSTLEQAIEAAAEKLPLNWSVRIFVENGYGGVYVVHPDGREFSRENSEHSLAEQVNETVKFAIENA